MCFYELIISFLVLSTLLTDVKSISSQLNFHFPVQFACSKLSKFSKDLTMHYHNYNENSVMVAVIQQLITYSPLIQRDKRKLRGILACI